MQIIGINLKSKDFPRIERNQLAKIERDFVDRVKHEGATIDMATPKNLQILC